MHVLFRPVGDLSQVAVPQGAAETAFLDRYAQIVGLHLTQTPELDREDWFEAAAMLVAARDRGLPVSVLPRSPLGAAISAPVAHYGPDRDLEDVASADMVLLGRHLRDDLRDASRIGLAWPNDGDARATHYAELDAFAALAGRRVRLADIPGNAPAGDGGRLYAGRTPVSDIGTALADFAGREVLIKQVQPAKAMPLARLAVPGSADPAACRQAFLSELGIEVLHHEGRRAALLVQDLLDDLAFETRFFVVDHTLVAGAPIAANDIPCLDCLGQYAPRIPLRDRVPADWALSQDSRTATWTGTAAQRARLWERLLATAGRAAEAVAAEAPDMTSYTLDLGWTGPLEAGHPVVVEMNPAGSAGLYGIDPRPLVDALCAKANSLRQARCA